MRVLLLTIAASASLSSTLAGQCLVAPSSNEGRLLAFYTVPIVFASATAPSDARPGSVRIGLEGGLIPKPNPSIQKTGLCFQKKTENTSLSPLFGRPRVAIVLPGYITIEGSYLPPITIADAEPNLASLAVAHGRRLGLAGAAVDLMLRAHTTFGTVKGPITCPREALQLTNPAAPCYGSQPSRDTFHPSMTGAELVGGRSFSTSLAYYAGLGVTRMDPHFKVGFTDGNGNIDQTEVELSSPVNRVSLLTGFTLLLSRGLDLGAQVYSVPATATTLRIHGGWHLR